jgi:hypothetical protein
MQGVVMVSVFHAECRKQTHYSVIMLNVVMLSIVAPPILLTSTGQKLKWLEVTNALALCEGKTSHTIKFYSQDPQV